MLKSVFVFSGDKNHLPSAVFSTEGTARKWIRENRTLRERSPNIQLMIPYTIGPFVADIRAPEKRPKVRRLHRQFLVCPPEPLPL